MTRRQRHLYEFGGFSLDAANRLLLRDGSPVHLEPKAFDMLLLLVERRGGVVTKDELIEKLWPDSFVEESNLSQNIYVLRKALGQQNGREFIKTVPKSGYQFVAEVRKVSDDEELIVEEHTRTHVVAEEEIDEGETSGGVNIERAGRSSDGDLGVATISGRLVEQNWTALASARGAGRRAPRRRAWALAIIAAAIVTVSGLALYKFLRRGAQADGFARMEINKLTFSGKVSEAAVSPDGKFVAYAEVEGERQNVLCLKQLQTGSVIEVLRPPEGVVLGELVFSPDGNFVYYLATEPGNTRSNLHRVSVLGGRTEKIAENVWSPVTFSPSGGHIAFTRRSPERGEDSVVTADAGGGGEQTLATRRRPDAFLEGAAWSPDGRSIACAVASFTGGLFHTLYEVGAADGAPRPLTERKWSLVEHLAWLADGSGLVVTASEQRGAPLQLWLVSRPGGVTRITNDLNDYHGVSLTANGTALATAQYIKLSNIWLLTDADASRARQITSGTARVSAPEFADDGRIVFSSQAGGNPDIWIMDVDGSNRRQLTFDPSTDSAATVSPDGRYVVFVSDRGGGNFQLWRSDADGGNPVQLTRGVNAVYPSFSPDGRWVVYTSINSGKLTLWKISVDGGEPVQLTDYFSIVPAVSTDGRWIACYYRETSQAPFKIGVLPFAGGRPVESYDRAQGGKPVAVKWTPDSRALIYADDRGNVSNLWVQSRAGGPPRQLTDFTDKFIFWFDVSREGRRIALERGEVTADAVLINNFR